eukprot:1483616-Prymnesium_polylepis.1
MEGRLAAADRGPVRRTIDVRCDDATIANDAVRQTAATQWPRTVATCVQGPLGCDGHTSRGGLNNGPGDSGRASRSNF